MSDKKLNELSDEQLEKVSGGYDNHAYLPAGTYGDVLGQYETEQYVGKQVYFVKKGIAREYYWGTLTESAEYPTGFGDTTRRGYIADIVACSDWGGQCRVGNGISFTATSFDVFPKIG